MTTLYIDIETTLDHKHIWMAVVAVDDRAPVVCTSALDFDYECGEFIGYGCNVVGHNIIGFDIPVLERVWNCDFGACEVFDTMVMSALHKPEERQSLKEVAKRYNKYHFKSDFETEDFDSAPTAEMREYAIDDVLATREAYKNLNKALRNDGFSLESIDLEHRVKQLIVQQERSGVLFDVDAANQLYSELCYRTNEIKAELRRVFPPIITERYSEKTGKRLKDDVEEFNPNSRQQIAKRLKGLGAKFTRFTEKGNVIIDEKTLAGLSHIPEARLLNESLMLQKRIGLLDGWFKHLDDDNRIRGRVRTNGAVTGRMTHSSPNLAQIPAVRSPYGPECRRLFIASPGKVMIGCDASGLELRMLAHYMKDDAFTEAVVSGSSEDGTDAHTRNQEAFGCDTRDQAKTLIYALLYGAGDAKLGSIVGGTASDGAELRRRFESNTPAYAKLVRTVSALAERGCLPGLDGRRLWVRHQHAALNTLLQGAGAVVMKKGLWITYAYWKLYEVEPTLLLNVHDEWQVEDEPVNADTVGTCMVKGIRDAGKQLNLRCPLDGEYKVGDNWAETH